MRGSRTYPPGVPCWIEAAQPDPEAARHFYGKLLGWSFEEVGASLVASIEGREVAGITAADGTPTAWRTYMSVSDAAAGAATVREAGGRVTADVGQGPGACVAHCVDPGGAAFGLWQPGDRPGAQAVNVPGAWNFSDLHTDDPDAAMRFYGAVFGWERDSLEVGGGDWATLVRVPGYGDHLEATVDPDIRARQASAPPGFADAIAWLAPLEPEREAPYWHVTFAIADRDAAVLLAQRNGAEVLSTLDSRWNRSAIVVDPQGALLTLSQYVPPQ